MFLLDTVVLSELRKARRDAQVTAWLKSVDPNALFVSVISIGEIERGIERQRAGAPDFARRLSAWLDAMLRIYVDRILPVTMPIARRWGRLSAQSGHGGADLMIAATALDHGLVVVSRNVGDFTRTGVEVLNPFRATSND